MFITIRRHGHAVFFMAAIFMSTFNVYAACPSPGATDSRVQLVLSVSGSNSIIVKLRKDPSVGDTIVVDGIHLKKAHPSQYFNTVTFPASFMTASPYNFEAANNSSASLAALSWNGGLTLNSGSYYYQIGSGNFAMASVGSVTASYRDAQCGAVFQISPAWVWE